MSRTVHSCPHCGCELTKPRSLADHRRFFAMIRHALMHWPENHEFRPSNEDHLRAWLLVSAGYFDVQSVPINEEIAQNPHLLTLARLTIEATVEAAYRDRDFAFPRFSAAGCEILRAKSINWETLDQRAFGPIREAVEDLVEANVGVKVDQLLRSQAA